MKQCVCAPARIAQLSEECKEGNGCRSNRKLKIVKWPVVVVRALLRKSTLAVVSQRRLFGLVTSAHTALTTDLASNLSN